VKLNFERKSYLKFPSNSPKWVFLKFQLWIYGRYRPEIGRFVAGEVCLVPKSSQNFFYPKRTKIDDFIQNNLPPPPKKNDPFFFLGGG